ncbi:MAG: GTPase [Planctomycetota bacterium]
MAETRWALLTPPAAGGAIAVVRLHGGDLDGTLERLNLPAIEAGRSRVADLLGVDRGVIARWSLDAVDLMPHAGRAVLDALASALTQRGIERSGVAPRPEAGSDLQSRMLDALAQCPSPLGIERLLGEPQRHAAGGEPVGPEVGSRLAHLLSPPLVVAVGPPNIGKSSLLNALAGRVVALAFDELGTTRDHVGVTLELDGLTLRYLDTAGLIGAHLPAETARQLASADLVFTCCDALAPEPPASWAGLLVATRGDRAGREPTWGDAVTSARAGSGIDELAGLIRQRLVPDSALRDPRPWPWWQGPAGP